MSASPLKGNLQCKSKHKGLQVPKSARVFSSLLKSKYSSAKKSFYISSQKSLTLYFILIYFCYVNLDLEEGAVFTAVEVWFTASKQEVCRGRLVVLLFPNGLVLVKKDVKRKQIHQQ